jgi:hypothetical protein
MKVVLRRGRVRTVVDDTVLRRSVVVAEGIHRQTISRLGYVSVVKGWIRVHSL